MSRDEIFRHPKKPSAKEIMDHGVLRSEKKSAIRAGVGQRGAESLAGEGSPEFDV